MKRMANRQLKQITAFLSRLFDGTDAVERFEFERELTSAQRTAHIRTWEYRNDRF
jgi:hypothetical protein